MKKHILNARLQSLFFFGMTLVAALIFMYLLPESWVEHIYKGQLYPLVRTVLNGVFGYSPIPAIFIIIALILIYLVAVIFYTWKERAFQKGGIRILSLLTVILSAFFWLWGIHYSLPSPTVDIRSDKILIQGQDVAKTIEMALSERREILSDTDSVSPEWPLHIEQELQANHLKWLHDGIAILGYPPLKAALRVRYWPKGSLLRVGVSGIYLPFTGEPTMDRALHALRMPSTALHEWGHSMGFTGEGDCNLIAYLAAIQSDNAFVRYSALLERLRDEMYLLAMLDFKAYEAVKSSIPEAINSDMMSIKTHHGQYRGKLTNVGYWINDQYLKSLGVEDGVDDYWKWIIKLRKLELETH
jgi:hypothetical protein